MSKKNQKGHIKVKKQNKKKKKIAATLLLTTELGLLDEWIYF